MNKLILLALFVSAVTANPFLSSRAGTDSCAGRCGPGTNPSFDCQCNTPCVSYGDCCDDYETECLAGTITDADLRALGTQLHGIDVNAVPGIELDLQGTTTSGNTADRAPLPLFKSVPSNVFNGTTINALIAFFDTWIPDSRVTETVYKDKEDAFLDAILATSVMQQAHDFINAKKLLPDSSVAYFREYLRTIWMGLYNRGGGTKGSSGLEHVFGGEIANGGVSGFHSWIKYQKEEEKGSMNYLGYISTIDLGTPSSMIEMPMRWDGIYKSISSIAIASSPELDIALATVCFLARPDKKCPLAGANGNPYAYQTYTLTQNGVTYVGSAYPTIP